MNCRIVGAICQHNFAQTQRVLISYQQKKAHYFEKMKIVILTILYILAKTQGKHLGGVTTVEFSARVIVKSFGWISLRC